MKWLESDKTVANITSNNKKAQLTKKGTRDSGACLKIHCEHNQSSRIPAVDIQHDDYED